MHLSTRLSILASFNLFTQLKQRSEKSVRLLLFKGEFLPIMKWEVILFSSFLKELKNLLTQAVLSCSGNKILGASF